MIVYLNLVILLIAIVALIVLYKKRVIDNRTYWLQSMILISGLAVICGINLLSIGIMSTTKNISNRDVLFVLDMTQSMNAVDGRDGGENLRIENAKSDIMQIVDNGVGSSFGLYGFDYKPKRILPLTTNLQDVKEAVSTTYAQTSLGNIPGVAKHKDALYEIKDYLKKQHELDPTRERIVVYMSDFEIYDNQETEEEIIAAMQEIRQYAGGFVNIVYGKDDGGKILKMSYSYTERKYAPSYEVYPESNDDDNKYLKTKVPGEYGPKYVDAISKPNNEFSQRLAKSVKGTSLRYTETDKYSNTIEKASNSANRKAMSNPKSQSIRQNWVYAVLAAVLLVWLVLSEILKPKWLSRLLSGSEDKK